MLAVRMAGWAFSVARSASSGPSKHRRERAMPSRASASSKVRRATANSAAKSRPMPTRCEPWPGKRHATTAPAGAIARPARCPAPLLCPASLPAQRVQHRESRIGRRCGAAAGAGVQVRAAARAEAAARLPAQRARGQREDDLLVHEGRQIDLVALVVAERQVVGGEAGRLARRRRAWLEHEDEGMVEAESVLLEAAGAGADHLAVQRAVEED